MFADSFGALNHPAAAAPKNAEVTIECTLEEFYSGSLKHVEYEIDEVQHDGRTIKRVKKTHSVQVNPGYGVETVLKFKNLGNQAKNQSASDLVIKFT
jgi:DnaJ-class molecular chaperone